METLQNLYKSPQTQPHKHGLTNEIFNNSLWLPDSFWHAMGESMAMPEVPALRVPGWRERK